MDRALTSAFHLEGWAPGMALTALGPVFGLKGSPPALLRPPRPLEPWLGFGATGGGRPRLAKSGEEPGMSCVVRASLKPRTGSPSWPAGTRRATAASFPGPRPHRSNPS
eukprot:2371705-Alexandrium_andersonii.AAC.1